MSQLKNGQIVTIATKTNCGKGSGFLYLGQDNNLYVDPMKPTFFTDKYLFRVEKPPQKSGGNQDLDVVYDGDDVLLKSEYNNKYARIIDNRGGYGIWSFNSTESDAKYNYRDQGSGIMEALRISSMNSNEMGRPVYLDGRHCYSIMNPRLHVYLSYHHGNNIVGTAGSAYLGESWFFADSNGHVKK